MARARQDDGEFGELAGLGYDVDLSAMLLDDDVVGHRQPKPRALAGRLGGEERVEHLFLHLGRDAGAVVADADFYRVAEIFRRGLQRRLKAGLAVLRVAPGGGIETVGNQVEQGPGDLLRKQLGHTGARVEVAL